MKALKDFWQLREQRKTAKAFGEVIGKHLRYKRDVLPKEVYQQLSGYRQELQTAKKKASASELTGLLNKGDRLVTRLLPPQRFDVWREHVEVIFVAVVAALAIRAYFYQPFKIPTDSMKPTLYGIQSIKQEAPAPAWPVKIYDQLIFGRAYHRWVAPEALQLRQVKSGMFTPWLEFSDLTFTNGTTNRVWANARALEEQGLRLGDTFSAGQTVYDFRTETGDQVLVNKWIYNFRLPHRGEPFVFKTTNIEGIEASLRRQGIEGSQYYIKRCVGLPDDQLQIVPPRLLSNGESAQLPTAMQRVMAGKNSYNGYVILLGQSYLRNPEETYVLPKDGFWAMGDNSKNSLDSRFWGIVPRTNLVGTATLVWWPFGRRWGLIE